MKTDIDVNIKNSIANGQLLKAKRLIQDINILNSGFKMDEVQFILIEDNEDLILSLSFKDGTEFGIDGFIIQRNPKWETTLLPQERGPLIEWTEDDEIILVKEVKLNRKKIIIKTKYDKFEFDISKILNEEYNNMVMQLTKMNFDNVFKFSVS